LPGLFGCVQILEFVGTGTQLVVEGFELDVLGFADDVDFAGQV
jgi:hypothetical protein